MFSRRRDRGAVADPAVDSDEAVEGRTEVRRDEVVERRGDLDRDEVAEHRREKRAWGGPPLVRAVFTLAGVGAAGFLIWLATLFELEQTSEFWSAMGLVAAGGLALGLSQLFGGWTKWGVPVLSPGVFLLAFIPTGVVVSQQDEKSQIKNRAKAMKVLRARLYEMEMQKQQDAIAKERRGQVGTGERSEKIRTYNFPQSRITDHRINFTTHQLHDVLEGDVAELLDQVASFYNAEKLRQASQGEA